MVPFHTAFQLGLWCVLILFVEIATSICTIPSISVSSPVKQGQGFLSLGQEQMNVKTLLHCWLNTGPSSGSYYCFFIVWGLETNILSSNLDNSVLPSVHPFVIKGITESLLWSYHFFN